MTVRRILITSLALLGFMFSALAVNAQPNIPRSEIPDDIPTDVKKEIERLYSSDPVERGIAAHALGEMGQRPSLQYRF